MAAQPVDIDTTAAQALSRANDTMAPAAGQESPTAKENQQMDTGAADGDESFNLSDDLPIKPSQALIPSSAFLTPASSPSPPSHHNRSHGSGVASSSQGQGTTDRPRNSSRGKSPGKFAKTIAGLVLHRSGSPSSLKRGASANLPMMPMVNSPRRGRMVLSDHDLCGSTGRLVHRKLEELPTVGNNTEALALIGQQFAADRATMEQM